MVGIEEMSDLESMVGLSRWKPYPAYRESGVEWLGQVPAHWKAKRVKFISRFKYGDSLAEDNRESGDVAVYGSNGQVGTHNSANTNGPCLVIGRKGSSGKITYSDVSCFAIDTTFLVDTSTTKANIRWLYYALSCLKLDDLSRDSAVPGLNRETAHNQWLPSLALAEQRTIAAFLDRETVKIDALITKKQRLIELLQEKRSALISLAVTKGLYPNAPMKDSGVAWLGRIPDHWKVNRLKFVAKLESGHTPDRNIPEYWENCTIPWVTLNDVGFLKEHDHISETTNRINELGLSNSSARVLPKGTVILSRDATVGMCGIIDKPMATSQHFVDWICGSELLNEYLLLVFRVPMQQEFMKLTMGATIRTIGMADVKKFVIPLPPVKEQLDIVDFIKRKTKTIDGVVLKVEKVLLYLREYRSSLISAAVTGKIDVR